MPGEISEQDESTQEEMNQVEMDTNNEKKKNKEQEDDNEIQRITGEISVFDLRSSLISIYRLLLYILYQGFVGPKQDCGLCLSPQNTPSAPTIYTLFINN